MTKPVERNWEQVWLTADTKFVEQCRCYAKALVLMGMMTPKPCFVCGSPEVESFHLDRRDESRVVWMCHWHHLATHGVILAYCGEVAAFIKSAKQR